MIISNNLILDDIMKLALTFRDLTKQLEPFVLKWKIKDTVLAQNWTQLLISNILEATHPIEKTYCLHGWQTTWDSNYPRNLDVLCQKLNHAINIINHNMVPLGYSTINLDFSIDKLRSADYQNMMNEIHHHFELLIGQLWDVSEWYTKTPNEHTRTAIRMLNNYCHEIESTMRTIAAQDQLAFKQKELDVFAPCSVYVSCNGVNQLGKYYLDKKIKYLNLQEFECFQDFFVWGDVKLLYAQLGKSHLEVFNDKDEYIESKNISSFQTLTGEFIIEFYPSLVLTKDFKTWCKEKGFDLNNKSLGIGCPVVATFENPFRTKKELIHYLRKFDDLYQIAVEDDQGSIIASKIYPHIWQEEENWKWLSSNNI